MNSLFAQPESVTFPWFFLESEAVPPWVGLEQEELLKEQIVELSNVRKTVFLDSTRTAIENCSSNRKRGTS